MNERSIFLLALELTDPADRAAYLDAACAGDPALRRRIDDLLAAHVASGSFMDRPAPDLVPPGQSTLDHGPVGGTDRDAAGPPGTVLAGRYVLGPELGSGGMGTVYRAEQTGPVRRTVAVKLIRPGMDTRVVLARFDAERQALAVMDHPNIAKVFDAGTTPDGRPFFAMELVAGVPLTDYCDAHRLPVADRLDLFRTVCAAVQHAHQKGIIHRDLKPSNILVEARDGAPVPKVIDFGLAKAVGGTALTEQTLHTAPGAVAGTPLYMAPEQAAGGPDIDTRADVYALGAILYELLTGTTPIRPETLRRAALHELLRLIQEDEPPAPSSRLGATDSAPSVAANRGIEPGRLGRLVRGDLDWVVMRALEKDRGRRYDSAAALAADVDRFLNHEPVAAGPPSRWYKARKFVRRNRAAVTAAGLVLLALVAGVVGTGMGLVEARRQRDAADLARLDAIDQRDAANAAREAEAEQRRQADAARLKAVNSLAQVLSGAELFGSIFREIDPRHEQTDARPLRVILGDRIAAVAAAIDGEALADRVVAARLQAVLGQSLIALGSPSRAAELLERAAAALESEPDGGGSLALNARADRAEAIRETGDYRRAVTEYEAVLRRAEGQLEADHPLVLSIRRELGESYRLAGRAKEAIPLLERVIAPTEARHGAGHLRVLSVLGHLAAAYQDAGRPEAAVALLEPAIAAAEARSKTDHMVVLNLRVVLGGAYQAARRPADAVRVLEPAVRDYEKTVGPEHRATINAKVVLANAYSMTGAAGKAVALLESVLPVTESREGADHPATLTLRITLGGAYLDWGKTERAVAILERALAASDKKFPPSHPIPMGAAIGLSKAYRAAGRPDRAVPMFERILAGFEAGYPPDHPEVLVARNNLAVELRAAGRPDLAVPVYNKLLEQTRRVFALGHPDRLRYTRNALSVYEVVGPTDRAADLAGEVVANARQTVPPNAVLLGSALAQLGSNLIAAGRHPEAEAALRESLVTKVRDEPNDWRTFYFRTLLGAALVGQKKYEGAEPELLAGYEGMRARVATIPPQVRRHLPDTADRLVALYEAMSKPDEVKRWRAERAKYPFVAPPPREK